jgi:hypothetical protein
MRYRDKWLQNIFFLVAIALPLLYTRRMYSIILLFQIATIYFLNLFGRSTKIVFRVPIILISILMILYTIQPVQFNIWFEKMMPIFEDGIEPDNVGTYTFRKNLLADSIQSIAENNSFLWGMGYQREYNLLREPGYSYVTGEDAPVASVIFCEGFCGLILRIFPYLALLLSNFKRLIRSNDTNLQIYAAAVFGVVCAQMAAYLQTQSITHFEYFFVPFAIIELILMKTGRVIRGRVNI